MNKSNGFTLIELLVGITLLVMILATVYASYSLGLRTYKKIEKESYINQNVRQAWRVVSRDLRCAFMSGANKNMQFIGEHNQEGTAITDKVTFVTYLPDSQLRSGGLTKVSYYINKDPQLPYDGLLREDKDFPVSTGTISVGRIQVIAPLVTSFRLRYFNGIDWKEQWGIDDQKQISTQANTLPVAVELQVKVLGDGDKNDSARTLTTIVPVMSN